MTEPEKLYTLMKISNILYDAYIEGIITEGQFHFGLSKLKQSDPYWFEVWR